MRCDLLKSNHRFIMVVEDGRWDFVDTPVQLSAPTPIDLVSMEEATLAQWDSCSI